MTQRRIAFFSTIAIAAIVLGLWLTWLLWPPDLSRVEPRLTALREPFARVQTYHGSSGTIVIEIVGADGRIEWFAIVCDMGSDDCYERVLVGAYHHHEANAAPAVNPAETRQQLIRILARYSGDPYTDSALAKLRAWPTDWLHCARTGRLVASLPCVQARWPRELNTASRPLIETGSGDLADAAHGQPSALPRHTGMNDFASLPMKRGRMISLRDLRPHLQIPRFGTRAPSRKTSRSPAPAECGHSTVRKYVTFTAKPIEEIPPPNSMT